MQVTILRCGLHSRPGLLPLTYYPVMPGNSTARPGEKWAEQRPAMVAAMGQAAANRCFQGATRVDCPVTTLAQVAREHQLQRIDLLKVCGCVVHEGRARIALYSDMKRLSSCAP